MLKLSLSPRRCEPLVSLTVFICTGPSAEVSREAEGDTDRKGLWPDGCNCCRCVCVYEKERERDEGSAGSVRVSRCCN